MNELRSFYDSIDVDTIHEFVDLRRLEDLYLEFKTLADGRTFGRDDRKNLAIALSGFANADGGILVWGISARPQHPDGIDGADELKPIQGLRRALSELTSHTAPATSPSGKGVESMPVVEDNDSGYLKTYVPPSDTHPCMAKHGEDRYYRRSGDRFRRMEAFELADMFGRRVRPVLGLHADIKPTGTSTGPGGKEYSGNVVLGIKNTGLGIARFPSIALEIGEPYKLSHYVLDGNRNTGPPRLLTHGGLSSATAFAGTGDHVVHVESILEVTCAEMTIGPRRKTRDLVICCEMGRGGPGSWLPPHSSVGSSR